MEKLKINLDAKNKRINSMVNNIYIKAKYYANNGYDTFNVNVAGTKDEFWAACLKLKEFGIHIVSDYTHNGMLGDKSRVNSTLVIKSTLNQS